MNLKEYFEEKRCEIEYWSHSIRCADLREIICAARAGKRFLKTIPKS